MGKATEGVKLDKITMPVEVVNEITQKIKERSFIAALVPSEPETFGSKEYVTWTEDPEGEFVGEGEAKSSSSFGMEPKEGKLHKFQVTVRMSDEVTWADEDNQLQILNALYGKHGKNLMKTDVRSSRSPSFGTQSRSRRPPTTWPTLTT